MKKDFRFKIVLVGDEAVGKTSLILRYINNTFKDNYIPTLGVNFMTKDLQIKKTTRLVIWDIGGQAEWKAKLSLYLKGADGAIITFDLTRPTTFTSLEDWISKLQAIISPNIPFIVVGNKNDLKDLRKVRAKDVKKFLKKQAYSIYFESSAKTGENVDTLFDRIAREIIKNKGFTIKD
ncbi:MAG: GTP-binding protein [Candidatus Helarchaeota archaeon]|nr:GTP-binding protein [Candidatus Helarchaeota archaeon]